MKLSNLKSVHDEPLKVVVYGGSGTGKTTLAKTISQQKYGRVLLISAEAGLLSIQGTDIDVIDLTTDDDGNLLPKEDRFDKMRQAYAFALENRDKFGTVFIDSLTEIGQNLSESLDREFQDKKDTLVKWGEYSKRMRGLIKAWRDIPGTNVVMTALQSIDKDEANRRFVGIDLQGKIASQIPQFFDEVLYLNVEHGEDGKMVRQLQTQPFNQILAKDRSGKLELFEPADLTLIFDKIKTKKGK